MNARGAEEWFRLVWALDLWTALVGVPAPAAGAAWWPKTDPPPAGVPSRPTVSVDCPLTALSGTSRLKDFGDDLQACQLPDLRVYPADEEQPVVDEGRGGTRADTALAGSSQRPICPAGDGAQSDLGGRRTSRWRRQLTAGQGSAHWRNGSKSQGALTDDWTIGHLPTTLRQARHRLRVIETPVGRRRLAQQSRRAGAVGTSLARTRLVHGQPATG
jgi:hypothetical protein